MAINRNEGGAMAAKLEASASNNGDGPGRRFCQCSLAIEE
jgi:hypothetical protein